jgi:hypothetical protein
MGAIDIYGMKITTRPNNMTGVVRVPVQVVRYQSIETRLRWSLDVFYYCRNALILDDALWRCIDVGQSGRFHSYTRLPIKCICHKERDDLHTSNKWSPRRSNMHLNTNNSNNNPNSTARIATVKPARREQGVLPNV